MNYSNNIFKYATSELSQDAFICWLCSFLLEENKGTDKVLEKCAVEFVQSFLQNFTDEDVITEIIQQKKINYIVKKDGKEVNKKGLIDVLLEINGKHIIIEDKTFTSVHDDQINCYKFGLSNEESYDAKDIICVFYKIYDQPYPEQDVDFEFDRKKILQLFEKYENRTDNPILIGYIDRLRRIESSINSFLELPMEQWHGDSYVGFYKYVRDNKLIPEKKNYWWGHANRPDGGFKYLWWPGIGKETLTKTLLTDDIVEVYPQFEEKIIALKIKINKGDNKSKIKDDYGILQKYAEEFLGDSFNKLSKYHYGQWMTVAYIDGYTLENYKEKMDLMDSLVQSIPEKFKKEETV